MLYMCLNSFLCSSIELFTEPHDVNFVRIDLNISRTAISGGDECAVTLL